MPIQDTDHNYIYRINRNIFVYYLHSNFSIHSAVKKARVNSKAQNLKARGKVPATALSTSITV